MPLFRSVVSSARPSRSALSRSWLLCAAALCPAPLLPAQSPAPAQLTIAPNEIVTPVSPMLYGMMTEEINHAFEGGLYADMVQNRTMRTTWSGIEHWDLVRCG
ncbi:MAG TPA: hypothetical protein VKV02_05600, partial [Acidobacteriaceae bacterium]|nr:hypothetical protein [Acidobacteriaceae bacterium]